jgi:hypothetical protein
MLERPYVVGEITLGQILDIARLPSSRKAFAWALAANSLSMSDFWRTLRDGKHGLTPAQASKVERAVTSEPSSTTTVPWSKSCCSASSSPRFFVIVAVGASSSARIAASLDGAAAGRS